MALRRFLFVVLFTALYRLFLVRCESGVFHLGARDISPDTSADLRLFNNLFQYSIEG